MPRLLICKDIDQKTILESRELPETENIFFEIIENPPQPEYKEGYSHTYILNEKGELDIEYKKLPKSELEELKDQVAKLTDTVNQLIKNNK